MLGSWIFLNVLEEPSIIIIDNASYHSKQIDRIASTSTRKKDIQEWLTHRSINYQDSDIREELLRKVKLSKPKKSYIIDQLANERGHEVIRLPSYHCKNNPIN